MTVEMSQNVPPRLLVVMGVSGSGKSTVAETIARDFDWPFQEGDDLHPPANVEKMHRGEPLTDADRGPWLQACHAWLAENAQGGGVLSCSALKRVYRDMLSEGLDVTFVYLRADPVVIRDRMAQREGHFMPSSLLPSQLATLEEPSADEPAITVDATLPPEELVAGLVHKLELIPG